MERQHKLIFGALAVAVIMITASVIIISRDKPEPDPEYWTFETGKSRRDTGQYSVFHGQLTASYRYSSNTVGLGDQGSYVWIIVDVEFYAPKGMKGIVDTRLFLIHITPDDPVGWYSYRIDWYFSTEITGNGATVPADYDNQNPNTYGKLYFAVPGNYYSSTPNLSRIVITYTGDMRVR
jgi:hypothetical protein